MFTNGLSFEAYLSNVLAASAGMPSFDAALGVLGVVRGEEVGGFSGVLNCRRFEPFLLDGLCSVGSLSEFELSPFKCFDFPSFVGLGVVSPVDVVFECEALDFRSFCGLGVFVSSAFFSERRRLVGDCCSVAVSDRGLHP